MKKILKATTILGFIALSINIAQASGKRSDRDDNTGGGKSNVTIRDPYTGQMVNGKRESDIVRSINQGKLPPPPKKN